MLWARSLPCNVMNVAFRRQGYQKFMCKIHFFLSPGKQGSPSNSCDRQITSVNRTYVKKWQQSISDLIPNPSAEAGRSCDAGRSFIGSRKQYYWMMTGWLMPCTAAAFPASFDYTDMLIQHTAGGLIYPPTCLRKVSMSVFYSCGLI